MDASQYLFTTKGTRFSERPQRVKSYVHIFSRFVHRDTQVKDKKSAFMWLSKGHQNRPHKTGRKSRRDAIIIETHYIPKRTPIRGDIMADYLLSFQDESKKSWWN